MANSDCCFFPQVLVCSVAWSQEFINSVVSATAWWAFFSHLSALAPSTARAISSTRLFLEIWWVLPLLFYLLKKWFHRLRLLFCIMKQWALTLCLHLASRDFMCLHNLSSHTCLSQTGAFPSFESLPLQKPLYTFSNHSFPSPYISSCTTSLLRSRNVVSGAALTFHNFTILTPFLFTLFFVLILTCLSVVEAGLAALYSPIHT